MGLTALAAVVSGLLLVCAFGEAWQQILTFILLGSGHRRGHHLHGGQEPYGYRGFGDISVFLFFPACWGCSAPTTSSPIAWSGTCLLPATACGPGDRRANINNVRDIETDAASGKITLAVRLAATGPSPITGSCWGGAAGDHRLPADSACEPLALDLPARHEALTDAARTLREFRWRGADLAPSRRPPSAHFCSACCSLPGWRSPEADAFGGWAPGTGPFFADVSMRCCFIRPM